MGLFDSLSGALGGALKDVLAQADASAIPALVNKVLAKTDFGDLKGLVDKLQASGLGTEVSSWLSNGANLPVSADQLKAALSSEQLHQIAKQLGLPIDGALDALAKYLPGVVDKQSPNGTLDPAP